MLPRRSPLLCKAPCVCMGGTVGHTIHVGPWCGRARGLGVTPHHCTTMPHHARVPWQCLATARLKPFRHIGRHPSAVPGCSSRMQLKPTPVSVTNEMRVLYAGCHAAMLEHIIVSLVWVAEHESPISSLPRCIMS
jgi:hypothetical protein